MMVHDKLIYLKSRNISRWFDKYSIIVFFRHRNEYLYTMHTSSVILFSTNSCVKKIRDRVLYKNMLYDANNTIQFQHLYQNRKSTFNLYIWISIYIYVCKLICFIRSCKIEYVTYIEFIDFVLGWESDKQLAR